MKNFKRIIAVLLAVIVVASLAACGGSKGGDTNASGAADDKGGSSAQGLNFTIIYGNNEGDEVAKVAQAIQEMIEENLPGVTIQLSPMTKAERLDKMQEDNYEIALTRWGPDYADPMTYLGMWITNNSNNYGFWSNPDYDAIIADCTTGELAGQYDKRWDALHEAEALVMNEAVIAPLYTKANANLIAEGLKGVEFHPVALNRVYKRATSTDGTADVMFATNVMSLDTNLATDGDSFEVIADCIDGLTQMDADGKAIPALAESWEVAEDGKTYTFHLKDAKWSNGDPVTANDFVFAWRRIAQLAGEYAYMLSDIGQVVGAAEIIAGEADPSTLGVTAIDDKTLEVKLNAPVSYFESLMYFPTFYPINENFYNGLAEGTYATSPETFLSNGAFVLTDYTPGTASMSLVKNADYYDAANVTLDAINYQVVGSSDNALTAFKNGTLDLVTVNGDQVASVQADPELSKLLNVTGAGYMWYLTFSQTENNAGGLLANQNLRLAISNAIDRVSLAENYVMDGSIPTYTAVPPQFAASSTTGEDFSADQNMFADVIGFDTERAQAFLEVAKSELGIK